MQSLNKILFLDIDDVLFNTDHFKKSGLISFAAYPDVSDFLSKIKTACKIAILSQGEEEFQKNKLSQVGIMDFFLEEEIFIVEEKNETLKNIFDQYKNFKKFVIDDRIINLRLIKKIDPKITTVLIKRGRYQDLKAENFKADFEIKNLEEILKIIE